MPSDKFKLLINSAAKTKKEIEDEVRRLIRSRIESVVEDAIRDIGNSISGGEKIPPKRENVSFREKTQQPLTADELAYPTSTPDDSLLVRKIRRMREQGQTFYNGYMLRQCAEITIVKQGEFMQDVTDDFGRTAFCAIERPVYGALSIEQLRTYFTWRTDVRRGVYNETDKPYIILYCYELLNKIGVLSSQDAFNRLLAVWENCRSFCPYLDKIMPIWLKDFYAFNNLDGDFATLESTFPVPPERSDKVTSELFAGNYHSKLEYLMSCSSYNLKGSIFMKEDRAAELMDNALEAVLNDLAEYFRSRDISLFELLCGRPKKDFSWAPFSGAYVNLDRMDGFRTCKINSTERFCIKLGQPCHEQFEHAPYRNFIGYVLKSTESVLRERTGFRYSISANINLVLEDFLNRDRFHRAASEAEFAQVIPAAVHRWCDKNGIYPKPKEKKKTKKTFEEEYYSPDYGPAVPPKVEIDIAGLERIRRESDEIAKKLIIEDGLPDAPTTEVIEAVTAQIEDDTFEERTQQAALDVSSQYDFSTLPAGWREFAASLDANSLKLLNSITNGTADTLCREMGLLPEAVFEQINDIALQHIGDVVIENGEIIPDYAEDISEIFDVISRQET